MQGAMTRGSFAHRLLSYTYSRSLVDACTDQSSTTLMPLPHTGPLLRYPQHNASLTPAACFYQGFLINTPLFGAMVHKRPSTAAGVTVLQA